MHGGATAPNRCLRLAHLLVPTAGPMTLPMHFYSHPNVISLMKKLGVAAADRWRRAAWRRIW